MNKSKIKVHFVLLEGPRARGLGRRGCGELDFRTMRSKGGRVLG